MSGQMVQAAASAVAILMYFCVNVAGTIVGSGSCSGRLRLAIQETLGCLHQPLELQAGVEKASARQGAGAGTSCCLVSVVEHGSVAVAQVKELSFEESNGQQAYIYSFTCLHARHCATPLEHSYTYPHCARLRRVD